MNRDSSCPDFSEQSRLVKNLVAIGKITAVNLSDDPYFFLLQAARKFDSPVISKFATASLSILPKKMIVARALAHLLSGNTAALSAYVSGADIRAVSDRQAARLANMLIAVQDPETTKLILLSRDSNTKPLVRATARYRWYMGDMDGAIELLVGAVPANNKQLRHYRSELEVFAGALPVLHSEPSHGTSIAPENIVLHLLTNSLPHTGSGYAQRSHSILTSLQDAGWRAKVFTRAGYPLSIGKIAAKSIDLVDGIGYQRIFPKKLKSDMRSRIQLQAEALAVSVRECRPSVLHTTTDFSNALSVMAVAEAFGLPWVYEVRGQLADTWASSRPESAGSSQRYKLFKEREAFVAARATHVVTLGEAMKQELMDQGVNSDQISIAPNAIGEEYLELPVERMDARKTLGLATEYQYVGTVSSLVSYEGLDLLVRAVAELVPQNPSLRLLIVGNGVERNNLISLSEKLGIRDFCIFPGRVPREEARIYHCALDVFVVPRRDLTVTRAVTPLKPVEALACEVPVVAADLPALRELVRHGETGLLVAPDDVDELAQGIDKLLRDSSKRASMGAAGRQMMLDERTWSRNAEKLLGIYELASSHMRRMDE